jgi:D-alanyl-D-alanine carboxypeptidase
MNDQAKRLGMLSTAYKNPEGLTAPGHITTANDLSILATRLLMHDFPEYVGYYAIKKYRYPGTARQTTPIEICCSLEIQPLMDLKQVIQMQPVFV